MLCKQSVRQEKTSSVAVKLRRNRWKREEKHADTGRSH